METNTRILIADANPDFCTLLTELIDQEEGLELAAVAGAMMGAYQQVSSNMGDNINVRILMLVMLAGAGSMNGILITGFNGGNSNSATGDFSFGVEGFLFKDGRIVHPVREILITGNLLTLWNNLLAAGDDARTCKSKIIPTLAFKEVDFSA